MKFATFAASLLALSAAGAAQVPPDIAEKTRALGQMMDPTTGYSPWDGHFDMALWDGTTITRGIAYGSDPAQVLDVYLPDGEVADPQAGNRPVLLFVHGGAFTGGRRKGRPYPDNVPGWAVREGMIGVSIDYRLAPAHPWPAGVEDLKAAIGWVREHIGDYGGDPARIVLLGFSAGGNHVADYISHDELHGPEFAGVRGGVLLSPFYAAEADPAAPHAYYGIDAALQSAGSQIEQLRSSSVPLFMSIAQYDIDPIRTYGLTARKRLCERPETCPEFVDLADHNHFTQVLAIGTEDHSLSGPLLAWMKRVGVF